ncbi:hypothetical protein [Paraburkholderia mimosarum]|uniref:hypothetical protein n=1 Tax=Paraburkholderia mimosarum TaxID=312026 RepID=UPI0003FEFBF3|nr:hypothetical protein [Paraburkholderia mimosarum]
MAHIYGASFLDMWSALDAEEVQAEWSVALRGVSRENLMRGVAALYHTRKCPTLPEFLELCAPEPAMYRKNPAITDERRTPPDQAREHLARIREIATGLLKQYGAPAGGGIRWAYRLLQRAESGEPITPHQIAFAKEAIEAYNRTHGTHGNREPGSDDE